MDDLPELPFEKVLSYLSLEDRLKMRAVSRSCYEKTTNSRVKSLCYSERPVGFIYGKSRWVSGAFAQNFISSPRFDLFVNTFGPTILFNLKRLRICDLPFNEASTFVSTLNLFVRLEELDLIRCTCPSAASDLDRKVELNLPMLASIYLEEVIGIKQLTLNAPKLKRVKIVDCYYRSSLRLELVHADSVECLVISRMAFIAAKNLKNLKNLKRLHCNCLGEIDATFLSGLEQLKEVHLHRRDKISELFEQKQRFGRSDLKIYLFGWLLNGPDDPLLRSNRFLEQIFHWLVEKPSRMADAIPLYGELHFDAIEDVAPGSEVNVVNRLSDLDRIVVEAPPPEKRFLDFLDHFDNIVSIHFVNDDLPSLFDQLADHCALQELCIGWPVSDFTFLFRLKHLVHLTVAEGMDLEMIRNVLEELEFLLEFDFNYRGKWFQIRIGHPKRFEISLDDEKKTSVVDLGSVISFIVENTGRRAVN